jgi:citrate/tricarballylate utilization protein
LLNNADTLFTAYSGVGSFYHVIPIKLMSGVSMLVCAYVALAFFMGFKKFWLESGEKMSDLTNGSLWKSALSDMFTLRHLGGGDEGHGCTHVDDRYSQSRKWFHHTTFYGFAMTIISTTIAAIYHYGFGWHAPYDMTSLPVIFGTIGGIMIVIGTIGLSVIKIKMDPVPVAQQFLGMEYSFITLLFLVSFTGLALLLLRDGIYMPLFLCLHLGFALAFFLVLPYSKFVHALYRFGALLKYAKYKER